MFNVIKLLSLGIFFILALKIGTKKSFSVHWSSSNKRNPFPRICELFGPSVVQCKISKNIPNSNSSRPNLAQWRISKKVPNKKFPDQSQSSTRLRTEYILFSYPFEFLNHQMKPLKPPPSRVPGSKLTPITPTSNCWPSPLNLRITFQNTWTWTDKETRNTT